MAPEREMQRPLVGVGVLIWRGNQFLVGQRCLGMQSQADWLQLLGAQLIPALPCAGWDLTAQAPLRCRVGT